MRTKEDLRHQVPEILHSRPPRRPCLHRPDWGRRAASPVATVRAMDLGALHAPPSRGRVASTGAPGRAGRRTHRADDPATEWSRVFPGRVRRPHRPAPVAATSLGRDPPPRARRAHRGLGASRVGHRGRLTDRRLEVVVAATRRVDDPAGVRSSRAHDFARIVHPQLHPPRVRIETAALLVASRSPQRGRGGRRPRRPVPAAAYDAGPTARRPGRPASVAAAAPAPRRARRCGVRDVLRARAALPGSRRAPPRPADRAPGSGGPGRGGRFTTGTSSTSGWGSWSSSTDASGTSVPETAGPTSTVTSRRCCSATSPCVSAGGRCSSPVGWRSRSAAAQGARLAGPAPSLRTRLSRVDEGGSPAPGAGDPPRSRPGGALSPCAGDLLRSRRGGRCAGHRRPRSRRARRSGPPRPC